MWVLRPDILGVHDRVLVGLAGENQSGHIKDKIQKHHGLSRLPQFKWETRR